MLLCGRLHLEHYQHQATTHYLQYQKQHSVHPGAGPPLGLHTVRASTPADNGKGAGNDLRHLLPASTSPPIKFSLFNNGLFSSKLCCALRCWCKTYSITQGSSFKCCIQVGMEGQGYVYNLRSHCVAPMVGLWPGLPPGCHLKPWREGCSASSWLKLASHRSSRLLEYT